MLRSHITYVVLFLFSTCINAQDDGKQFIQITTNSGLSQSNVRSIYQDRLGYMWFGTADGLNRYDGKNFRVFTSGLTQDEGIIHPYINDISKKNEEEMWICTALGVSIYNLSSDKILPFHYFQNQNIERALSASNGEVWFGSQNGLHRYIPDKDLIYNYTHSDTPTSIAGSYVRAIYEDSQSNIWIGTNNGISLYNPESQTFTNYLQGIGYEVRSIVEDHQNRLWFGVSRNGVYEFVNYQQRPSEGSFSKLLAGNSNRLLIDGDKLWIGESSAGNVTVVNLNSIDSDEGLNYEVYKYSPHNTWGLSDYNISSLFKDRNGDIWIGTYSGGVNLFSERIKKFKSYIPNPVAGKTISSNLVTAFLDDGNYIWIGTGAGLDRMHKSSGDIQTYYSTSEKSDQLYGEGILSIYRDSRNNLWVGTWNGGLNLFDPKTESFKVYAPSNLPGSISSPHVTSIIEDKNNDLWIATSNGGLNRFDYKSGEFEVFKNKPNNQSSLPHNSVNHLLETSDGSLMLTCYTAFSIMNNESGLFTNYSHNPDNPKSLRRGQTLSVFEDSHHNIWVAGNLGLNLFDKENGTFTHYTTHDGLPNNTIQGILEDDHKNLWISTNKGIVKFINGVETPETPNFRLYDQYDGLPTDDFRPRAATKGKDGFMNFGTSNGFIRFHPDQIIDNNIPPEIIITDFNLFGTEVIQNVSEQLKETNINNLEEIRLTYKQNNFIVYYSAINYLNPEKNRYKYKLEGNETQWREVDNIRFATYTNLSPGSYTFKVTGTNNDGVWGSQPKELKIIIIPPWWQTTIFRIGVVIIMLILIYLGVKYRFKSIQCRNKELEESVANRTLELSETNALLEESKEEITCQNYELEKHRNQLEELVNERTKELIKAKEQAETSDKLKTAFLANLSHELRTPMNAIVGFSNLLAQPDLKEKEKQSFIQIINSNTDTLLTLINDILDISLIETNQLKLNNQWFSVNALINELFAYYNIRNEKELELKVTTDPSVTDVEIFNDPIRIKQVLSNLISNAMKFTNKGQVHFGWEIKNKKLQFYVKDSGIGIPKEEIDRIFKSFYKIERKSATIYGGTGLGLSLSNKILGQMGSQIIVESEPDKGSIFYFSLSLSEMKPNINQTKNR